jgi:hypothetical protein
MCSPTSRIAWRNSPIACVRLGVCSTLLVRTLRLRGEAPELLLRSGPDHLSTSSAAIRNSERRCLIRRAVGERHRCQLRTPSSGQAELDPPAEEQAGGDAMAVADLRHADAVLLRLLHHRPLLLVAEAAPVARPPVHRLRCQSVFAPGAISSAA